MHIKYASKLSIFCYAQKFSKFLVLLFPCWDIIKSLNASMLTTAVFELVQQFYHATEWQGSQSGQHSRCLAIADKTKTIVSDKLNYRGTQS